jgi:hypothetical protein
MALSRVNHKKGKHPKPVGLPAERFPLNQVNTVNTK